MELLGSPSHFLFGVGARTLVKKAWPNSLREERATSPLCVAVAIEVKCIYRVTKEGAMGGN